MELNNIYNMECIEGMKGIPDKSIDMILCDLPYGTTACKWDEIIPFEPLWEQYERVIKDKGAIVLTASQPFTSALVMSNPKLFKHSWIWHKDKSGNFMLAKSQPMKVHEDVLIFGKKTPFYSPIMEPRSKKNKRNNNPRKNKNTIINYEYQTEKSAGSNDFKYPTSVRYYNTVRKNVHPTQKPLELFEYLIKTYTIEGETVLDNCMGSGTTAIACMNTDRNYIGFELDHEYYKAAMERIKNHADQLNLFD